MVESRTTVDAAFQNISRKSSGNFLYAVQVLDGIARDDYSFANLDALPRGLDGIYLDFFRRIFGHENTEAGEAAYQRTKPLLQVLCTALEPLTRAELAAASQLDPEEDLPQILRKLAQLLTRQTRATGEETLSFHHKSVPDWLTTHLDANAFAVGPTKGRNRLSEFCRESLAAGRAKPGWYVRRHAVEHFLEVADWDSATEALCDLEFIEARAIAQELPAMLMDYAQAAKLLPEGEKERQTEAARQAELDRYAREMYEYAAAWSRIRDGSKEKAPCLPSPVKSVRLWTEEEIAAERKRMTETPNRLDRVKAFRVFVASNKKQIQQHATQEGFAANIAKNDSPAGPVHEEGKRRLAPLQCIKLIKSFSPDLVYNPLPACIAVLEGHRGIVTCVALSADGRRILSGSRDKTLRLWEPQSGKCLKVLKGHTSYVTSVSLCLQNHMAISGSWDKSLRIWNLETGDCVMTLTGHTGGVNSVAFSPDGRIAASASGDKTVRIWDLKSGHCTRLLEGHVGVVNSVSISANGRLAISASWDKTLRIWDITTGVCLKVIPSNQGNITSVIVNADGLRAISSGSDETICVWDITAGDCIKTFKAHTKRIQTSPIDSLCLSTDASYIFSVNRDNILRIWNLHDIDFFKSWESDSGFRTSISLSSDCRLAVFGCWDSSIQIWNLETGESTKSRDACPSDIQSIRLSDDGRCAYSWHFDKTISVWSLNPARNVKILKGIRDRVNSFAISADSRVGISASAGGVLCIWDLESGLCSKKIHYQTDIPTFSFSLSNNGHRFVWGRWCDKLAVFDLISGNSLKILEGHTDVVHSFVLTSNDRLAISASWDKTIRIWDLDSGACINILSGHTDQVYSVALSPDERYVVSGGQDTSIRVWDLASGLCVKVLCGHTSGITLIKLSSDGRRIISKSRDRTLRLWDMQSGDCLNIYEGKLGQGDLCALSADNRTAATKDRGTLRLLDLDSGTCRAEFFLGDLEEVVFHPALRKVVASADNGSVQFFDLENLLLDPLIATAHRKIATEDLPTSPITARPPCCGRLITIPVDLAERIDHWHLIGDERGDNAYTDPALLINCSSCETPLRMNPFFLDV